MYINLILCSTSSESLLHVALVGTASLHRCSNRSLIALYFEMQILVVCRRISKAYGFGCSKNFNTGVYSKNKAWLCLGTRLFYITSNVYLCVSTRQEFQHKVTFLHSFLLLLMFILGNQMGVMIINKIWVIFTPQLRRYLKSLNTY